MPPRASKLSNDPDLVKYTKYSKKRGSLPDLARVPPPNWQPLQIDNVELGSARLPDKVDASDPIALFDLFFDAAVLDRIAYHTNEHAQKLRDEVLNPQAQPYARP
ncbi:hypothetical protein GQ44DRAFT_779602 [Phaeosphaeriaceae sp. PMI808]|nr:hypothetical protein GQ44DRAFT_779602 [Phaeosphaeriaceae sp. PMI808]